MFSFYLPVFSKISNIALPRSGAGRRGSNYIFKMLTEKGRKEEIKTRDQECKRPGVSPQLLRIPTLPKRKPTGKSQRTGSGRTCQSWAGGEFSHLMPHPPWIPSRIHPEQGLAGLAVGLGRACAQVHRAVPAADEWQGGERSPLEGWSGAGPLLGAKNGLPPGREKRCRDGHGRRREA